MAVLKVAVAVQLGDEPPIVMQHTVEGPSVGGPDAEFREVAEVLAQQATYALTRAGRALGLPFSQVLKIEVVVHEREES